MAFFASVKASSVCIRLSCLVCIQSVVYGVRSHLFCGHEECSLPEVSITSFLPLQLFVSVRLSESNFLTHIKMQAKLKCCIFSSLQIPNWATFAQALKFSCICCTPQQHLSRYCTFITSSRLTLPPTRRTRGHSLGTLTAVNVSVITARAAAYLSWVVLKQVSYRSIYVLDMWWHHCLG